MRNLLVLLGFVLLGGSLHAATSEERDLSAYFDGCTGEFVLLDATRDHYLRFCPEQCRERSTPCSTFKIFNSLMALDTGAATGPEFSLAWDGVQRPIDVWNQDQTMRSAFAVSCLWYYEALAAKIGLARAQRFITAADYGNKDASSGLPHYWLAGSLTISPDEQVNLLRRLHAYGLPFSARAVNVVLDIMTLSDDGTRVFRGKTGTAGDVTKGIATLGWFVGSVSLPSGDYFFATRLTGGLNPSGRHARVITEAILRNLKLLPASSGDTSQRAPANGGGRTGSEGPNFS